VRQGIYTEHDAIYLQEGGKISWGYELTKGYYLKTGEDEESEFYRPSGGSETGHVIKAALADNWQSIQAYKNENKLCVVTVFNVHTCRSEVSFERRKRPALGSDAFQQTLIYNGRVGNKINIGYREFSNNLARPAFNNNVEYDLNQSMTIGYKGARIEVIEATNEYIKYKVLSNFNKAQF
jgi:hypothetical protein